MIPVSTLYDEYIDRPKLTEQKNAFEYIVPSPSRGVGTIIMFYFKVIYKNSVFKAINEIVSFSFTRAYIMT